MSMVDFKNVVYRSSSTFRLFPPHLEAEVAQLLRDLKRVRMV